MVASRPFIVAMPLYCGDGWVFDVDLAGGVRVRDGVYDEARPGGVGPLGRGCGGPPWVLGGSGEGGDPVGAEEAPAKISHGR